MTDDVMSYFWGDYAAGDPRKTKERRFVGNALDRCGVISMNRLAEMTEYEINRIRNIGETRRAVLYTVLAEYRAEKEAGSKPTNKIRRKRS